MAFKAGDICFVKMDKKPDYAGYATFVRSVDERFLTYRYLVWIEGFGKIAVSPAEIFVLNSFFRRLYAETCS